MTYPCHHCNMDEGSPVCVQDERCPGFHGAQPAQAVMSERQKAICAALGAAAAAREQDLRGQYPKAARVLAEEVFRLRKAMDQKHAEYEDMKSLLLGNARNLNLERERLHAALQLAVWAMRAPLDDWKGECERKALDAANAAVGPNVELTGRPHGR